MTVLAEDIHKPHNISAIVRTCDAVGIYKIHAVTYGDEFPRNAMAAAGSAKWVDLETHNSMPEAIVKLKENGFYLIAAHLSERAVDYREVDYTRPFALALGSELTGVSEETAAAVDIHVQIPMRGMVESLNVSVANAIILYEAARQRETAAMYGSNNLTADEYNRVLFEWAYPDIARRCREKRVPYPALDEDGYFHSNPFSNS